MIAILITGLITCYSFIPEQGYPGVTDYIGVTPTHAAQVQAFIGRGYGGLPWVKDGNG
jgi:hypothetical protein